MLDEKSDTVKIYNEEMRIVKRYLPNKAKHGHRAVRVRWFDFN